MGRICACRSATSGSFGNTISPPKVIPIPIRSHVNCGGKARRVDSRRMWQFCNIHVMVRPRWPKRPAKCTDHNPARSMRLLRMPKIEASALAVAVRHEVSVEG
jgi:hypothetical protein